MKITENPGQLQTSMVIPAYEVSYALAVQYLKEWFLSKFNNKYFKGFNVAGRNVLKSYKNFNINELAKVENPKAAMVVDVDYDHNRDSLDIYQYGIDTYVKSSRLDRAFFKDHQKNIYIGLGMEEMLMRCVFRVRVDEKAQQLRLYKYMQMAFRVKATETKYIDCDFNFPYSLAIQIAKDAGFIVENDTVVNEVEFLAYLNSHSPVPIIKKFRNMTGRSEYFLRMQDVYTHINVPDNISLDNGDEKGQTITNFNLELQLEFKMPCPKFYAYYSMNPHEDLDPSNTTHESNLDFTLCAIRIPNIPECNDKGWNLEFKTDCEEDDLDKPLEIDLNYIFGGCNGTDSEILKYIKYNNLRKINSNIFLDLLIYNDGIKVDYTIDWEKLILKSNDLLTSHISNIYLYVNNKYINDIKMTENNYKDSYTFSK